MAEGVFRHLVEEEGLSDRIEVDSCGTSDYNVGKQVHPGTRRTLREQGIEYDHRARAITWQDLAEANYIIPVDRENMDYVRSMGRAKGELILLLSHTDGDVGTLDVPDPYLSGDFEAVYRLVEAGCQGLLDYIREQEGL
jgi:protein-tyrosine phosphatase